MRHVLLVLTLLAVVCGPARADQVDDLPNLPQMVKPPPGLPRAMPHPADEHTSLYDQNCCNANDCEPIPGTAVRLGDDGWHVEYVSPRPSIGWVRGVVPYGQERVSKGCVGSYCWHACARRREYHVQGCDGSPASCMGLDWDHPAEVHCLYVDQGDS
jgi:hypothetical protein